MTEDQLNELLPGKSNLVQTKLNNRCVVYGAEGGNPLVRRAFVGGRAVTSALRCAAVASSSGVPGFAADCFPAASANHHALVSVCVWVG